MQAPLRRSFRPDLNYEAQLASSRNSRVQSSYSAAMAQWKATCESRQNHLIMLRMLVVESFRFRYGMQLSTSQQQELLMTISRVESIMDSSDEEDCYGVALAYLCSKRAFSSSWCMPTHRDSKNDFGRAK